VLITMANAFSLSFDSIGHRVCEMLHAYPGEPFTLGQVRAAADIPYSSKDKPTKPAADTVTTGQRSITAQLNRLIAAGLVVRFDDPFTGRHAYRSGPTALASVRITDQASNRPGTRPDWLNTTRVPPTPAAAAAEPFIL
jgi:hypothetical protein